MTTVNNKSKVLTFLGFAKKSGKLSCGADQVIGAVRSGRAGCVVLASDASERTKKQICDKCKSHGVPLIADLFTGDDMARAVGAGMTLSAVAVTDRGLAAAIVSECTQPADRAGTELDKQLKERIFPHESGNR